MAKTVILTDYYSPEENEKGGAIRGNKLYRFRQMLARSGLTSYDVRPAIPRVATTINSFLSNKAGALPDSGKIGTKYISNQFAEDVDELKIYLSRAKPNLVITAGQLPTSLLLGNGKIDSVRGTIAQSDWGYKVLPTYAPSNLVAQYGQWPIVLADLMKGRRESEFPEIRRPVRHIWIKPTYEDLLIFEKRYLETADAISIDIETAGEQITCIGFTGSKDVGLVVPFFSHEKKNYWDTLEEELKVWAWVKRITENSTPKFGQNFMYDMVFLYLKYGIKTPYLADDTMLMHHAMEIELKKGLGFLSSIYLNEASWKFMRANLGTVKQGDDE